MSKLKHNKFPMPTLINPPGRICVTIRVPDDPDHWANFWGALDELAQGRSYFDGPPGSVKGVIQVWRDVLYNVEIDTCKPIKPINIGIEQEDFMPLRVDCDCNVFVTCCDGTEKQLLTSDQVKALLGGSVVDGAPQPGAGACQDYNLTIHSGQLQIVPTTVNTGDTITLVSAKGATTQDGVGWQCPDGSIFFGGACAGGGVFDGAALMPAVLIGKVILFLNSVYYDLTPGVPFTVPGGVSVQTPYVTVNYDPASTHFGGDLQTGVKVCNNAALTFTHTFDMLTAAGGFTAFTPAGTTGPAGHWVPGTGWQSDTQSDAGLFATARRITIKRTGIGAFTLNSIEIVYTQAKGTDNTGGAEQAVLVHVNPAAIDEINHILSATINGVNDFTGLTSAAATTEIVIYLTDGVDNYPTDPGGQLTLTKLVVGGNGADPF